MCDSILAGEKDMTQAWAVLKDGIQKIHNKDSSDLSFERLSRCASRIVLYKHGRTLYLRVRDMMKEHLIEKVREQILEDRDQNLLSKVNQTWCDHQTAMKVINDILMYMNNVYVKTAGVESIYNLSLILFRDEIIYYSEIRNRLRDTLLGMVAVDRGDKAINHGLAGKNICQMLIALSINSRSVYEDDVEKPFLVQTASFYRLKSQKLLAGNNLSEYLIQVHRCCFDEKVRVVSYLDEGTVPHVVRVVKDEMITKNSSAIRTMGNPSVVYMIKNTKMDELARIYRRFARLKEEGLKVIADMVSVCLREQGEKFAKENENNEENPIALVEGLLDLKDHFDQFLHRSFNNDRLIANGISLDFEHCLNLNNKLPECLSLFIGNKLKRVGKGVTEQEIENIFDKTMVLFRCLRDKDEFMAHYQAHLTKRLLLNIQSSLNDYEKGLASRLTNECGRLFTSKLEGILKDMSLSDIVNHEFNTYIKNNNLSLVGVKLTVEILTTGYWPIQAPTPNCNIPSAVRVVFLTFKKFYLSKHSGRKLTLQPQLGSACINAVFYNRKIEIDKDKDGLGSSLSSSTNNCIISTTTRKHMLIVSTFQMCILMPFNNRRVVTYKEIEQETNISERELRRALQSLLMGKPHQCLLMRHSETKTDDIEGTDEFRVNDAFVSKFCKVKMQTMPAEEDLIGEAKETKAKVYEDRKHHIEAAIVRVMKVKKRLSHYTLVLDVTSQLTSHFLPSPVSIKKRIEGLIEREFLARTEEDRNAYVYLP
uniref:Cullin family profile domain-containing protein n=1 Tax=Glossina pallidipes TaxID=7398 RepID=A0A1A9ZEK1_GLOPL